MRIGIVVNDVATEVPPAATTVIAYAASCMGHDVRMIGVGDMTYHSDGRITAVAVEAPRGGGGTQAEWLAAVQARGAPRETIGCGDLDMLYLRYNPVENVGARMWEQDTGIVFGQMAVREGTLVLNHPDTLTHAVNKMYLEYFPAEIRPRTVITRRVEEIQAFLEEQGGEIVLKPLRGYGGKDVFLLRGDAVNLHALVESIGRDSYVIAQEFLPAASEGDIRLFLVNGRPLQCEGHFAAVRRVNHSGDFRSNMSAGAKPFKAEITDRILEIAEMVRPRLVADGMFEVGIDIVGDKLVEINVISSGGLNAAGRLEGVDFGAEVVRAIERKVEHRRSGAPFDNRGLATME